MDERSAAAPAVVIVEYDLSWPDRFEAERGRIVDALGDLAVAVEHVGSTAVPGLAAKAIIDLAVALPSLDRADEAVSRLGALGYERRPAGDFTGRLFLARFVGGRRDAHLSLSTLETEFWRVHLLFRDRLREEPELAREYEALKRSLATRHRQDRQAYLEGKTDFVARVTGVGWMT
jgi:GrpB-like predicted nucleotidyltransferase (UPF0157 family)